MFYSSFVCISACANVYFKTTITKQNMRIILIAGVPSSQARMGFLVTAPSSVCVPDVIVALAVWIQNQKKKPIPPNPTWVDIFESSFKAQSSKLERLFCHVSVKRDVLALSFEL